MERGLFVWRKVDYLRGAGIICGEKRGLFAPTVDVICAAREPEGETEGETDGEEIPCGDAVRESPGPGGYRLCNLGRS